MTAAVDRIGWSEPPPLTLGRIAVLARECGRPLRAVLALAGRRRFGEVFFLGDSVLHARVGWALGRRALARLAAEPFFEVQIQLHVMPDRITVAEAWPALRPRLVLSPTG